MILPAGESAYVGGDVGCSFYVEFLEDIRELISRGRRIMYFCSSKRFNEPNAHCPVSVDVENSMAGVRTDLSS